MSEPDRSLEGGKAAGGRWLGRKALHVAGLSAFALAQPLLQTLAGNPEFLVAHRATHADVLLLLATLLLVIPGLLVLLVGLAGRLGGARSGEWVCAGVMSLLVAMLFLQVARNAIPLPAAAVVLLAVGIGMLAGFAYLRLAPVRSLASFLAVGLLVFPVVFLTRGPIAGLLLTQPGSAVADGSGGEGAAASSPVVLVVFDQLPLASLLGPDERIDASLNPSFAALADKATWFRHATSVGNKSAWAVPAIVTGRYPDPSRRLPSWVDYPENLFTLLAPSHELRVSEPITELCPPELCGGERPPLAQRLSAELGDLSLVYAHFLAPPAWAERLPSVSHDWKGFGAPAEALERVAERARDGQSERWNWTARWVSRRDADRRVRPRRFIAEVDAEGLRPGLYFMHALLPHEPYVYLPSGTRYREGGVAPGLRRDGTWAQDEVTVARTYQRHLLQVGYVDTLLGNLVDRLREVGLYDRSLVIVTADHGASFRPGTKFKDPSRTNFADILAVPLLVKRPHQTEGEIDDRPVETIDVLPTVAEHLGIDVPWEVDGASLLSGAHTGRAEQRIFYGSARGRFVYEATEVASALTESVARKHRLFQRGPDGNLLYGPHPELVGTTAPADVERSAEDPAGPGPEERLGLDVGLGREPLYALVDLASDFVPAELEGSVERREGRADSGNSGHSGDPGDPGVRIPEPVPLAIAVNGRIRATTVSQGTYWTAIVPEDAFHEGENRVEVFFVDSRGGAGSSPVLHRVYDNEGRGLRAARNLVSSSSLWAPDVELSGFYPEEIGRGVAMRWTDGAARIVAPVDSDRPPRAMRIFFRYVHPEASVVQIRVDGCLIERRVFDEPWRGRIPFGDCVVEGDEITIEIESNTYVPAEFYEAATDPRRLGVAVASLVLVEENPGARGDER